MEKTYKAELRKRIKLHQRYADTYKEAYMTAEEEDEQFRLMVQYYNHNTGIVYGLKTALDLLDRFI